MIYVTSDLHLSHKNIINYCPESRNFDSVEQMNETLKTNWNNRVPSDALVYILGDISFGSLSSAIDILQQLNGRKILIVGNHDRHAIYKPAFKKCFEAIHDYLELKHHGHSIVMCHYPFREWNGSRRGEHSSYHFHGHCHSKNPDQISQKIWDCGLDGSPDFAPYLLDDLIDIIDSRLVL